MTRHWLKTQLSAYTVLWFLIVRISQISFWLSTFQILFLFHLLYTSSFNCCWRHSHLCTLTLHLHIMTSGQLLVGKSGYSKSNPVLEQVAVINYTWKWLRTMSVYPSKPQLYVLLIQLSLCLVPKLLAVTPITWCRREEKWEWKEKER